MKIQNKKIIDCLDWNVFVEDIYKRPYNLQQQDGCQPRGTVFFTIPDKANDFPNESVPEIINGNDMGVSFAAWLARDPSQTLSGDDGKKQWGIDLWWERNFYPNIQMIANDLYSKGLLEAGEYGVLIDY